MSTTSTTPVNLPLIPVGAATGTPKVLPQNTSVPTASAAPKHLLDKLGDWFRDKFLPVAKVVEKDAVIAAEVAEPFVDVAVPGIAGLYHTTLQLAVQAQAVASGASGLGAAKMSAVVSALEPLAIPYLKSLGVSEPTTAQIEAYVQSVIDGLKIFTTATTPAA